MPRLSTAQFVFRFMRKRKSRLLYEALNPMPHGRSPHVNDINYFSVDYFMKLWTRCHVEDHLCQQCQLAQCGEYEMFVKPMFLRKGDPDSFTLNTMPRGRSPKSTMSSISMCRVFHICQPHGNVHRKAFFMWDPLWQSHTSRSCSRKNADHVRPYWFDLVASRMRTIPD